MQGRLGPDRAPAEDFADYRKANDQFTLLMRAAIRKGKEVKRRTIDEPDIILWRNAGYQIQPIDNGPGREQFIGTSGDLAHRARQAAVDITVALNFAKAERGYQHAPHTRPRKGRLTIFDLTSTTCRFPTANNGQHLFCGDDIWQGSYCACHAEITTKRLRRA